MYLSSLLFALSSLASLSTAALSSGCNKAPTVTSGVKTISVNGQSRRFTIRVPSDYRNGKGYKVVYGLHWVGGRMDQVANGGDTGSKNWKYYGMQMLANETAIFVAPQGISGNWCNSGGSDVKLIDAMNEYIDAGLCVETIQRFSTGFSYGGSLTYAIACSRAKQFCGVAVIAGGVLSGCDGGNDPIAYFGIHGISDRTLNIAGWRSMHDRFIKNNGCGSLSGAKEPSRESRTHITTAATGCTAGFPVKWAANDGGHIQAAADKPAPEENGEASWVGPEVWSFGTHFETSGDQASTKNS